ncbi:hypothetical protein [Corynebacterium variabile]|uniref:hypothetical protein n=1 Tax=Corynebacterium variabile TaxID=1727 RepID=UPI0028AE87BD|nr:hypothetical protein [Corynebacterium variabile]
MEAEKREADRHAALKAQRLEAEEREEARAVELQEQRDETSHIIQLIAAVILPTTLVFTTTGGTGIELNLWAIVSAVVVSVLLTVFFVPRHAVSDLRRGWSRRSGNED